MHCRHLLVPILIFYCFYTTHILLLVLPLAAHYVMSLSAYFRPCYMRKLCAVFCWNGNAHADLRLLAERRRPITHPDCALCFILWQHFLRQFWHHEPFLLQLFGRRWGICFVYIPGSMLIRMGGTRRSSTGVSATAASARLKLFIFYSRYSFRRW